MSSMYFTISTVFTSPSSASHASIDFKFSLRLTSHAHYLFTAIALHSTICTLFNITLVTFLEFLTSTTIHSITAFTCDGASVADSLLTFAIFRVPNNFIFLTNIASMLLDVIIKFLNVAYFFTDCTSLNLASVYFKFTELEFSSAMMALGRLLWASFQMAIHQHSLCSFIAVFALSWIMSTLFIMGSLEIDVDKACTILTVIKACTFF